MDTVSSLQLRCLRLFDSHWSPFLHLCSESPSWVNDCRRLSVLIFCRRRRISEVSVGAVALTCESRVTRSSNEQDSHAAHEAAWIINSLCGVGRLSAKLEFVLQAMTQIVQRECLHPQPSSRARSDLQIDDGPWQVAALDWAATCSSYLLGPNFLH